MAENKHIPRGLPLGLALATAATLLLEITFTRIFSVTMWYHFAFMAISIAIFGMAVGSVIVYLRPKWFPQEKIGERLALLAILFSVSTPATFWLHLQIPFTPMLTVFGVLSVVLSFILVTIPFTFSGLLVSLVLTRFPKSVGRLYAFDLVGAAFGCLFLWAFIRPLTGPGVVILAAVLAALAAVLFSLGCRKTLLKKLSVGLGAFLVLTMLLQPSVRIFEIKWVKNMFGAQHAIRMPDVPMIERWNTHSVITVFRVILGEAFAWGMSPTYKHESKPQQLFLTIDAAAGTVITKYSGKSDEIRHLKFDVTSLAHHIRPESEVLIIGTGGGRDLLASLLFNPKRVTGVEINDDILNLINNEIGNFTGHLDRHPKLRFINDEARSWTERSGEKFDIIQASLIDSWAATSAGAFVLTENSLYTVEAWTEFLKHLTDRGVLTMSRWWVRDRPGEMIRMTSLAYAALRKIGADHPRRHVMIATTDYERDLNTPNGVGTIVVSRTPFSKEDIESFNHICEKLRFRVLLTPEMQEIKIFGEVLDPLMNEKAVSEYPLNIAPPTDDDPFFFNMLRFRDIFNWDDQEQGITSFNVRAITILGLLFILVVIMSFAGLFLPLAIHEYSERRSGATPLPKAALVRHGLYFASIGLGFILVEIGQMQRLTLFLGHPVYSLTVVLFSILLATGIGSFLSGRLILGRKDMAGRAVLAVTLIFGVTLLAAIALPSFLAVFHGAPLPPRIAFSIGVLFALGIPMGAAFPLGLHYADREIPRATPWLWAINGAFSVVGSVLAMLLSIGYGISLTCAAGALLYLIALLALQRNLKAS